MGASEILLAGGSAHSFALWWSSGRICVRHTCVDQRAAVYGRSTSIGFDEKLEYGRAGALDSLPIAWAVCDGFSRWANGEAILVPLSLPKWSYVFSV